MDPRSIEAFVRRDWARTAASKRAYWADRFREDWRSTWDAAQALLSHARHTRSPFPSDPDRELDLASHVILRERLDRVAHAFSRR